MPLNQEINHLIFKSFVRMVCHGTTETSTFVGFFFFLMAYQVGRVRENTNFIRKLSFIHFYKTNLIVSVFLLVNRCFKMFITFS